jgi:hypothetical protein
MGQIEMIELGTDAAKLVSVLNYDGMPITADNTYRQIKGSATIKVGGKV